MYHGFIIPNSFHLFRDHRLKLSDFQYSVKMKNDSYDNQDREIYEVKTFQPYSSDDFKQRLQQGKRFSRKQLVEADK